LKDTIANLVGRALAALPELHDQPELAALDPEIERARDARHGDFASNVALRLAKPARCNPRKLAESIVAHLPEDPAIARVEIAGPGFINFFVTEDAAHAVVADIHRLGERFGYAEARAEPRVLVEYISANPTGPLHVGHGRLAAYGATLANLLRAAGYPVDEEYYVNDAGRQMEILAVSVWVRLLQSAGESLPFPQAGYRGGYIADIATELAATPGAGRYTAAAAEVLDGLPADGDGDAREAYIDALIARAETLLGDDAFDAVRAFALERILDDIREDLAEFGVRPGNFFSERSLSDDGSIDAALAALREHGVLYEKNGAVWFRATDYGDEKDRVVVRDNGKKTYFASDIAYHYNKCLRGYDLLLDVLGSDHHGYVTRVRAGIEAMGFPGERLEVQLVQFVALYRGGEKLQMGTRSGNFVTLRELRNEVGNDAARFFYIMRSNDQHLDFDLELAKSRSNDNPVYYIQYAHARVASVFRQLDGSGQAWRPDNGLAKLGLLSESHESELMTALARFPETVASAAARRAPQTIVNYLRELANAFHTYYNAHVFLVDDGDLRDARLALITAAQQVLRNGLAILGVSAPDKM
jgi:arginyl-tRNA synthetase